MAAGFEASKAAEEDEARPSMDQTQYLLKRNSDQVRCSQSQPSPLITDDLEFFRMRMKRTPLILRICQV